MFINDPSIFLKDAEDETYVGLDSYSGGYPYRATTLKEVHFFSTVEEAEEYANHWPGRFTIHRLTSMNSERIS
ncbi:hypothetical protein SEA_FORREST_234 [Streptomyces phage Forrest]|nr:hypothetical protein SEA_FORREST_234 [Streptomyces phage Forrest]QZE11566.1 hypothetical protein SEA_JADA_233 [Streptomyces phage Jada]